MFTSFFTTKDRPAMLDKWFPELDGEGRVKVFLYFKVMETTKLLEKAGDPLTIQCECTHCAKKRAEKDDDVKVY